MKCITKLTASFVGYFYIMTRNENSVFTKRERPTVYQSGINLTLQCHCVWRNAWIALRIASDITYWLT